MSFALSAHVVGFKIGPAKKAIGSHTQFHLNRLDMYSLISLGLTTGGDELPDSFVCAVSERMTAQVLNRNIHPIMQVRSALPTEEF